MRGAVQRYGNPHGRGDRPGSHPTSGNLTGMSLTRWKNGKIVEGWNNGYRREHEAAWRGLGHLVTLLRFRWQGREPLAGSAYYNTNIRAESGFPVSRTTRRRPSRDHAGALDRPNLHRSGV